MVGFAIAVVVGVTLGFVIGSSPMPMPPPIR
jgi:ABC-type nitrate/sulfonate/bicarbonate transport system permease component